MAVCAEYRLPHSEFLSWSSSDRDKAIWWLVRDRQKCRTCGTRPDEWDEDAGGHRRAYLGDITQCEGCVVMERLQSDPALAEHRGMKIQLVRNPNL